MNQHKQISRALLFFAFCVLISTITSYAKQINHPSSQKEQKNISNKSCIACIDNTVEKCIRLISNRAANQWRSCSGGTKAIVYLTAGCIALYYYGGGPGNPNPDGLGPFANHQYAAHPPAHSQQNIPVSSAFKNEIPDKKCTVCIEQTVNRRLPCYHYYCNTCVNHLLYGETAYRHKSQYGDYYTGIAPGQGRCPFCNKQFLAENVVPYEYQGGEESDSDEELVDFKFQDFIPEKKSELSGDDDSYSRR